MARANGRAGAAQSGPRLVIGRFTARRTLRSATFLALAFGIFTASKTLGYIDVYPTAPQRAAAGALMSSNAGFTALFGGGHALGTASGYAAWYGVGLSVLMVSIWAYLAATKALRGEETAGRWELFLSGPTTARQATAQAIAGLTASLLVFYGLVTAALTAIGRTPGFGYGFGAAAYFGLVVTLPALLFMAVGALASQIMATRARAAGLATAVYGLAFLLRAAGAVTSAKWLTNVSPLGWIDQLQPLTNPQPGWLVPLAALWLALTAAAVYLAGRRDLGTSLVADRDTAPPRLFWLASLQKANWRFTRGGALAWGLATAGYLAFFGLLTDTAAKVLNTGGAQAVISALTRADAASSGAKAFLGVAFMMYILIAMAFAANQAGQIWNDEASGYADHILVRPLGRQRWLWGRLAYAAGYLMALSLVTAVVIWVSLGARHYGLSFGDIMQASLNALPPALLVLGIGTLVFGLRPRLTTVIAYGSIAWSFMVQMLASGTKLSHWLLDTSILYHVALAPAVAPNWSNDWLMTAIGLLLMAAGAIVWNRRDLAAE